MKRAKKPATTNSGRREHSPNSSEWEVPPTSDKGDKRATPKLRKAKRNRSRGY